MRRLARPSPRSIAFASTTSSCGGQQLVLADVGQEELQAVARARRCVGLVDDRLGLCLGGLLLGDRLAHLEPDALELASRDPRPRVAEVVLDGERLELGRFDPAALLARLEQRAGAFGLKQFGQLVLSQVRNRCPFVSATGRRTEPSPRPGYGALANAPRRRARFRFARRHLDYRTVSRPEIVVQDCCKLGYDRFFAARFVRFGAGPRSRRSWSSSAARSWVIDSTESPARRLALVSPSVTYGPKRPSLTRSACR